MEDFSEVTAEMALKRLGLDDKRAQEAITTICDQANAEAHQRDLGRQFRALMEENGNFDRSTLRESLRSLGIALPPANGRLNGRAWPPR